MAAADDLINIDFIEDPSFRLHILPTDMLQKLKPFFRRVPEENNNKSRMNPGQVPSSKGSRQLNFHKYQGAGNDFIVLDNMNGRLDDVCADVTLVRQLCDRRFGIGADGLIQICKHPDYPFEMKYYNSDGREGSLCGNGARCALAFARQLGLLHFNEAHFLAWDGPHYGIYDDVNDLVHVKLGDVNHVTQHDDHNFLVNTGSPHHVVFMDTALTDLDIMTAAPKIRYGDWYKGTDGANVNFVQVAGDNMMHIRTYERGIEGETLACGTGSVASVLTHAYRTSLQDHGPKSKADGPSSRCSIEGCNIDPIQMVHTHVAAQGGQLIVAYDHTGGMAFKDIYLIGPAKYVFSGTYTLPANVHTL